MIAKHYLALDFGNSGGKAFLGTYDGKRIVVEEIYRFDIEAIFAGGYLQWDILALYHELLVSIQKSLQSEIELVGIGIDSWGSDFSLLDESGYLLGNPLTNRDRRKDRARNSFYEIMSEEQLFCETGVQLAESSSSTLLQLYAILFSESKLLESRSSIIKSESTGHSWLQRNCRPITMLTFLLLVVCDSFDRLVIRLANKAIMLLQISWEGLVFGFGQHKK